MRCSARPALGDIGEHFPPSDPQWKGAASRIFPGARRRAWSAQAGGMIDHVDCTVICEEPKVGPHRDAMRARDRGHSWTCQRSGQHQGNHNRTAGFYRPAAKELPPRRCAIASGMENRMPMSDYLLPDELVTKAREVVEANRKRRAPGGGGRKLHRRAGQRRH